MQPPKGAGVIGNAILMRRANPDMEIMADTPTQMTKSDAPRGTVALESGALNE